MDTYPYAYRDFMEAWLARIYLEYPEFTVLGETWLQREAHTAYWQEGSPASGELHSSLRTVTDFPLCYALKSAFTEEEGWTTGLARLYYVLSQDFLYADPFRNVVFADNHDLTRFYTGIGEDLNKFKMAMAFLLTTRGIPLIYYGTEYLMTGEESQGHGFIRQDFPEGEWQMADSSSYFAAGAQEEEALRYVKTLLNWRKASGVIHYGKLMQFIPEGGIYVYFRYDENSAVMVAVNKNKEARNLDLSRYNEMIKDYRAGKDVITGREYMLGKEIPVPAETALVMEME
jgi:glycosidase